VRETAWKALNNIDPQRDIEFVLGPVDSLDHASRLPNFGSRWAWMLHGNGRRKGSLVPGRR
jgi:3-polyprenyl-4-hydroxybenzoate decarboxylase